MMFAAVGQVRRLVHDDLRVQTREDARDLTDTERLV
jgi:hypothetical protein